MRVQTAILAEIYLSWLPAWTGIGAVCLGFMCVALWAILRFFGGASQARGRHGLYVLRGLSLLVLAIILLGPTIVDEQAGKFTRPVMLYLFDGSQSMLLGQQKTRWEDGLQFVRVAQSTAGDVDGADVQAFRFGHRLESLASPAIGSVGNPREPLRGEVVEVSGDRKTNGTIKPPNATDSRLADALRQLLPQVSSKGSAGIVLLSDGRVRASESVEKLAELFGQAKVPLHVVPLGEASGNGDVAIVSLVVPPRVRKYTENELQVFLRSYGFSGQRTTVRVVSRNRLAGTESATLASIPITLTGGAQSVSLTFRVNEQPEDLVVIVDPVPEELTDRNNQVATRVEIDRTKVRVLYLESSTSAIQQSGILSRILTFADTARGATAIPAASVQEALQADEDVECTVLVSFDGGIPRSVPTANAQAPILSFPKTRAELFAYDCIVFSDLAPSVLTEEQNEWLTQWIEGRGGGLIVTGGEPLSEQLWKGSALLPLLPVHFSAEPVGIAAPREIDVALPRHPVWRLRLEHQPNAQILEALPPLWITETNYEPKATAEVLAKRRDDGTPVMMTHRVGRGRVLVSSASLGGNAFTRLSDLWGPQPERVAAKFWRNLVYWATEGSSTGRRRLVAESDKLFYRPGDLLSVFATTYDETARRTDKYQVWAMFEPVSLDDASLYSPLLWPEHVVRDSGEVSPRVAWGEEISLAKNPHGDGYGMSLMLSETGAFGDSGLRIELTAYEGAGSVSAFDHGTQVDSNSLAIQILTDPFELQNPLPNFELLQRIAAVSGGEVIKSPAQLAALLKDREETVGPPHRELTPAWSRWWWWGCLLGLISTEWIWRRVTGLA